MLAPISPRSTPRIETLTIDCARFAQPSVARLSAALHGVTALSISVIELPPRLSSRSVVSFDSRYGTWAAAPSLSAATTLPRHESERLMEASP